MSTGVLGESNGVVTPASNTGSKSDIAAKTPLGDGLTVGVDYFRGTCWLPNQVWIEEFIGAWLKLLEDEAIWEHNQGSYNGKQWSHRGRSVKGLKWWWNNPGDGQAQAHLLVSASGSVMSQIPIKKFWEFSKFISAEFKFKVTRLDIAIDDYQKRLKEEWVEEAAKARNFAIVQDISPYKTYSRRKDYNPGFCWYFGSKQSLAYARFYDKEAESKGAIPSYRLEGQFTDEKAHLIWKKWISATEEMFDEHSPQYLAGSVLGLVEFVDRNKDGKRRKEKNIPKLKRLPWWKDFIKAIGSHIRHSVPREDMTFERMLGWLEKQVVGSLAIGQKVMGLLDFRKWLDEKMAEAAANFRKEQEAKIVQWSKGKSDIRQRSNGAVDMKDGEGQRWIWVWRETPLESSWTLARFLSANATTVKVRFSGEASKTIGKRLAHFGEDKPTWVPERLGNKVRDIFSKWQTETV